jgi:glycerol-3-phosphate dehydrogenase
MRIPFLPDQFYDLLVIGGGVTGAGIALDAQMRGLKTALVEARDFASGTSGRSSKLIHGGLRYLKEGEFHLIYEAVHERKLLRSLAPHIVRPLPFLLPLYKGQKFLRPIYKIGLFVYEAMVRFQVEKRHKFLSAEKISQEFPGVREEGLLGGYQYYDAQTYDARFVYELIRMGREVGVESVSYTTAVGLERRKERFEVRLRTREGDEYTRSSRSVILAVGAVGREWISRLLPREPVKLLPSKGVHLVLPHHLFPDMHSALVMIHPRDGRVTFLLPRKGYIYLGTTDTYYEGDPWEPQVTLEDVEYLLEGFHTYFPRISLSPEDISASWAGIRPLVGEKESSTYRTSREHRFTEMEPGLYLIEGGKFTTYRVMAKECVDKVVRYLSRNRDPSYLPCRTHKTPFPGSRGIGGEEDLFQIRERLRKKVGLMEDQADHLTYTYGSQVLALLPYLKENGERVIPHLPYTWGEIRYILEQEDIFELSDLFLHRTEIYFQDPDHGVSILPQVGEMWKKIFSLSDEEVRSSMDRYLKRVEEGRSFGRVVARS